jgi:hypothetical protein
MFLTPKMREIDGVRENLDGADPAYEAAGMNGAAATDMANTVIQEF